MDGILNINKPKGFTSHDVVNIVRNRLKVKVGHTGTLDPNATGVLPLCLGKATKMTESISKADKVYKGILILGKTTDTQDITGKVLSCREVNISREDIQTAVDFFVGGYEQIPPMYSAVKIKGKRLYELARKNIEIERPSRAVKIYSIIPDFLSTTEVELVVHCGKGTYIRALCRDIGEKLGVGGVLGDLCRLRVGDFKIEDSFTIEEFREGKFEILPADRII